MQWMRKNSFHGTFWVCIWTYRLITSLSVIIGRGRVRGWVRGRVFVWRSRSFVWGGHLHGITVGGSITETISLKKKMGANSKCLGGALPQIAPCIMDKTVTTVPSFVCWSSDRCIIIAFRLLFNKKSLVHDTSHNCLYLIMTAWYPIPPPPPNPPRLLVWGFAVLFPCGCTILVWVLSKVHHWPWSVVTLWLNSVVRKKNWRMF